MSTLHTRGHQPAGGTREGTKSRWRDAWASTRASRGWTDYQLREMDDDLIWWADAILTHRYEPDPLIVARYDRELRQGEVPF